MPSCFNVNYDSFYVPSYKLFSCLRLPQSHQTCDQVTSEKILESLSNRRENVPLIVCDRTSTISRNKVDGHVQNCLRSICDYKSQTYLTWSYHQSLVVTPPVVRDYASSSRTISSSTSHKLFRLVVRPIGDASHDLHLQSLTTIGGTCKRAITNDWRSFYMH